MQTSIYTLYKACQQSNEWKHNLVCIYIKQALYTILRNSALQAQAPLKGLFVEAIVFVVLTHMCCFCNCLSDHATACVTEKRSMYKKRKVDAGQLKLFPLVHDPWLLAAKKALHKSALLLLGFDHSSSRIRAAD